MNLHIPKDYRPDIDGMRGLAVLLVVVNHAFPQALPSGFIGVDVFFIISGYLITNIILQEIHDGKFSLIDFYSRRIRRIFPSLFVVLLSSFAFGWFFLLGDEFKQLGKHIFGGATFISNILLWQESGYFDQVSAAKPLLNLWSLGVEEQYYIIWPLILMMLSSRSMMVLKISIAIFTASFFLNVIYIYIFDDSSSAFFLPQSRFWELMLGAILSCLPRCKILSLTFEKFVNNIFLRNTFSIAGFGCIFLSAFISIEKNIFPGFFALLPCFGAILVISAGSDSYINKNFLSNKYLVWVGLISYPLYLWHWPLLSFEFILFNDSENTVLRVFTILFSFFLAVITYHCIEKRFRYGNHGLKKSIVLLFLMICIGYVGLNTYMRDGLIFRLKHIQFRLPEKLQQLGVKQNPADHFMTPQFDTRDATKQTLVLWGDSYAGHLVAGFNKNASHNFNIKILDGGCPPLLNTELSNRPNCPKFTENNLNKVLQEQPDYLVLAANWTDYRNWIEVEETIKILKSNGINNIALVGPAPQWKDTLYKQLYLDFLSKRISTIDYQVPYRMDFGLNPNFYSIEAKLKVIASNLHVSYLSVVDVLCNSSGCITRFGESADSLSSFDGGHLTKTASEYVVKNFIRN